MRGTFSAARWTPSVRGVHGSVDFKSAELRRRRRDSERCYPGADTEPVA